MFQVNKRFQTILVIFNLLESLCNEQKWLKINNDGEHLLIRTGKFIQLIS